MSVVLLLSLARLRWRPVPWQWEVNRPLIKTSIALSSPMETCREKEAACCVVNKSFSAAGPGRSNRALHIGFVACQNIWVNFALYPTMSKAMFVMKQLSVMGYYLSHETLIKHYNITDKFLTLNSSVLLFCLYYLFVKACHSGTTHWDPFTFHSFGLSNFNLSINQ